jgi:drug/metabolite transporter (DMT)-like permease
VRPLLDRPRLLLTLTSLFWAGNVIVGRAIAGTVPPVTLACLRWVLATLIFLPFAWPSLRGDASQIAKHRGILLFLGLIGPACYNSLFYFGLVSTPALNGLVLNAAGPMFIALVAWSVFGDRLSSSQAAGMAAGFAGVLLIIVKGDPASLAALRLNSGDLILLAAILAWSTYTAFLRKRPRMSWQSYNLITYAIAAIANVPIAIGELAMGAPVTPGWAAAAAIVYVAIFPSLLAYIFYNRGVELLGPAAAGLYMFLIPGFGALLAVGLLGEQLHWFHAAGFALILGGVLIGSRRAVALK